MGQMIPEEVLLALATKNSGGGGGGTSNYNELNNKPQIAGVELSGNKSLADLGIASTNDLQQVAGSIPDELADLTGDSGHRTVSDTEKSTWNGKQSALPLSFSGNDITTNGNLTASGHVKDGLGNDMESLSALEQTASGNPIVVNAQDVAAKGLIVRIEPIQSGTGDPSPTNIRPISGRTKTSVRTGSKNFLPMTIAGIKAASTAGTWTGNKYAINGVEYELITNEDGEVIDIKATGTAIADAALVLIRNWTPSAGSYILNGCQSGGSGNSYMLFTSGVTANDTGSGANMTVVNESINVACLVSNGYTIPTGGLSFKPMVRLSTESDSSFVPYKAPSSILIQFGQTVYGGTLDVKTGGLTITDELVTYDGSDDENWSEVEAGNNNKNMLCPAISGLDIAATISDGYCNQYKVLTGAQTWGNTVGLGIDSNGMIRVYDLGYNTEGSLSAWKTHLAANPLQLCYELASPTSVQLTGAELVLLKGYNYITADGIIDFVYVPESITGQAEGMFVPISMLGTNESGNTKASRAYTSGEYFYQNGKMYKTITSIASGATFTVGTNCTQTTLFAELKAAQN